MTLFQPALDYSAGLYSTHHNSVVSRLSYGDWIYQSKFFNIERNCMGKLECFFQELVWRGLVLVVIALFGFFIYSLVTNQGKQSEIAMWRTEMYEKHDIVGIDCPRGVSSDFILKIIEAGQKAPETCAILYKTKK